MITIKKSLIGISVVASLALVVYYPGKLTLADGPTLVQNPADPLARGNFTSTLTRSFSSSVTIGNYIIVTIAAYRPEAFTFTISDNCGNTYTPAISQNYGNRTTYAIYYTKVTTTGACTVTATSSGSNLQWNMEIAEFSGLDPTSPLDTTGQATGSGTGPTVNLTTSNPNDLIVGVFGYGATGTYTMTAGVGFTEYGKETTGAGYSSQLAEYKIVSNSGSQTVDGTIGTSATWYIVAAAFKAAGGAAPAPEYKRKQNIIWDE